MSRDEMIDAVHTKTSNKMIGWRKVEFYTQIHMSIRGLLADHCMVTGEQIAASDHLHNHSASSSTQARVWSVRSVVDPFIKRPNFEA